MSDNGIDINVNDLIYQSDLRQSYNDAQYISYDDLYNSFENENINGMSTYNILRYLYRKSYDLRSKGYIKDIFKDPNKIDGKEKHPITGELMDINYFNDFSISSKFNIRESNDFNNNIFTMNSMALFPFINENGKYKNIVNERTIAFLKSESIKKENKDYTTDFFSYNSQVNPLLYTYRIMDINQKVRIMDADSFLRFKVYDEFNNLSYVMKGNQSSIVLWNYVTNINSSINNIEDDDGNIIGNEISFEDKNLYFKDDYTNDYMHILQNPRKYFKFIKQNDYITDERQLISQDINKNTVNEVINEEDSRGHLFYDTLLDITLKRVINVINNDNESNDEDKENAQIFYNMLLNNTYVRNLSEFDGFPLDVFLAGNRYSLYNNDIQKSYEGFKNDLGPKIIGTYRYQYNVVFGQYFRLLPYILSLGYRYKIQSPSMNIMYTAFTLMAIKNAYYHNKEDYDKIVNRISESINNINNFTIDDLKSQFNIIFDQSNEDFLSKNIGKHLENILPILIQNTSSINYNGNNQNDLDEIYSKLHYHVESNLSKIEFIQENVNDDNKKKILIDRALILLTEFFYKADKIRYFDASTFCIDYTLVNNTEVKKSLKLFSDALMEACYIHMNILGSEVFFNGEVSGHDYIGNICNISKNLLNDDVIEFDTTRVAKCNNKLYEESLKVNNNYKNNSFNSYLSVINIYISLCYCINITLDNLGINIYNAGPYTPNNIRRTQSVWTILKRYSLHMTYINNNSYGIYNDVSIGNNDADNVRKIMVSQRLKWLTYGLHLRVWFNDGYFFYTNYKKCVMNFNGDIVKAIKFINETLYNNHANNITEPIQLFKDIDMHMLIPMPNIGLATAPMMGSYGINVIYVCMLKYLSGNNLREYILSIMHHGLKDIMVGDSMSSILGERFNSVRGLLNNEHLSYNNINNNLQKIYNDIQASYFYEVVISHNLNYLYVNYIKKYFTQNPKACLLLNSTACSTYDEKYFNTQKTINEFNYAYDCTWCSDIFENLIFNNKFVNKYMRFINKLVTLYRIYVDNFYTYNCNYNKNSKNDSILHQYYDKYYGLSLMNSHFVNKYKKGLNEINKKKSDYVILNRIIQLLFKGNTHNDNYKIANTITMNNCLFGFEDLTIRNVFGGTMLAMYESPYMLLIFNNLDFDYGLIPSQQNLYTFIRHLYINIHSIMKRLIVELNYNRNPFAGYKNKDEYISDSINDAYVISDKNFNQKEAERYSQIINKGNFYLFATSICQFFDYDFLCAQYSQLLNNEYNINDENDMNRFMSNFRKNRGDDISRFDLYCKDIDGIENYLNSIINNTENGKIIEYKKNNTENDIKDRNYARELEHSEYPTKIDDKSNIIKFTEEVNKRRQEYLNKAKKQLEEINFDSETISNEVNNINNNINNNNIQNVGDNMIVNAILQMCNMLSDKLDKINNNIILIKDISINSNNILLDIRDGTRNGLKKLDNIKEDIPENIIEDNIEDNNNIEEETIENNQEETIEYENIFPASFYEAKIEEVNEIDGIPINEFKDNKEDNEENSEEDNEENVNNEIINNEIINNEINKEEINDLKEYVDFYKENNTDPIHVYKDYEPSIINENNDDLNNIEDELIPEEKLNEEYDMNNIARANYDDYYYIPKSKLIEIIPYAGFNNNNDNENNINNNYIDNNIKFKNYDLNKAKKQNIPIYILNLSELILPIDNIPIIFNQKIEYIIDDIKKRIEPINPKISNKLIIFLQANKVMKEWNNNMKFKDRIYLLKSLYSKIKNNKLMIIINNKN